MRWDIGCRRLKEFTSHCLGDHAIRPEVDEALVLAGLCCTDGGRHHCQSGYDVANERSWKVS